MPPLRPLPPNDARNLLEKSGFSLLSADKYNWFFARDTGAPIVVPHTVDLIPFEVVFSIVRAVGFEEFSRVIHENDDPWGPN